MFRQVFSRLDYFNEGFCALYRRRDFCVHTYTLNS